MNIVTATLHIPADLCFQLSLNCHLDCHQSWAQLRPASSGSVTVWRLLCPPDIETGCILFLRYGKIYRYIIDPELPSELKPQRLHSEFIAHISVKKHSSEKKEKNKADNFFFTMSPTL